MGIKGRVVGSACCLGRPVVAAGAVVFVVCRNFLASVHGRIVAPHSLSMSGFDFFFFVFFHYMPFCYYRCSEKNLVGIAMYH